MPVLDPDDEIQEEAPRVGILASRVLTDRDQKTYWPPCEHGDGALRVHVLDNGTRHYKFQCLICGRRGSAIRRDYWLIASLQSDPPEVDLNLETQWWQTQQAVRRAEFDQERSARNASWLREYNQYLTSSEWQRRRQLVLKRDGYRCQAEFAGCTGRATQAHHLTYDHVFHEPLFDLISVCVACHEQLTAMDRERRAAA